MKNIDVSFIIPVYNVEKYLAECIESIIMQTQISYEIILVNDGSMDKSIDICKNYSKQYPYIYVIDKINEGVSVARNIGIKSAKGKYICFIDADDFYCEDFAKKFVDLCNYYCLDIIRGLYKCYDEENKKYLDNFKDIDYADKVLKGENFLVQSIKNNTNEVVPWLGLFRRSYLIDNNLFFPESIDYEEDQLFFLKALIGKNCNIMQIKNVFYVYRKRIGSCTAHPKVKNILDACYISQEEINYINAIKLNDEEKSNAYKYVSWSFFQVTTLFGRLNTKEQRQIYKKIPKNLMNHAIKFPTNKKNKYKVMLLKYIPRLYAIIFRIIRKEVI